MEAFEHLNFYELLSLPHDASSEDIKRAFRQQIARYHPDHYRNASSEEQEYVSARTRRINEAYRTLSDVALRKEYDHKVLMKPSARYRPGEHARSGSRQRVVPRDHQAELYEQAKEHLQAGRYMQASATLRELQKLNPFYRDVAALLEQARAGAEQKKQAPPRQPQESASAPQAQSSSRTTQATNRWRSRIPFLVGGVGAMVIIGLLSAALLLPGMGGPLANEAEHTPAGNPVSLSVVPTAGLVEENGGEEATPAPPSPPTATPTATPIPPSPTPTTLPPPPEPELLLMRDDFSSSGEWATQEAETWSVGTEEGVYAIQAQAGLGNILSFHSTPDGATDYRLATDVQVRGGAAGLVLHFVDGENYHAFLVDPRDGSFWLEVLVDGERTVLVQGISYLIQRSEEGYNHLEARLDGSQVELFINGSSVNTSELLASSPTDTFGLVARAEDAAVNATFDNLEVRRLKAN